MLEHRAGRTAQKAHTRSAQRTAHTKCSLVLVLVPIRARVLVLALVLVLERVLVLVLVLAH
jgi:hypothetical protein